MTTPPPLPPQPRRHRISSLRRLEAELPQCFSACAPDQNEQAFSMLTNMPWLVPSLVKRVPSRVAKHGVPRY